MRLVILLFIRLTILLVLENIKISVNSCVEKTSNENYENVSKGYFTNNISDYQIIVPIKVTSSGEFVSNYLPHFHESGSSKKRKKREIFPGEDLVHYHIPINGKIVKVKLTPNKDPFPSSMLIEHQTSESTINIGKTKLRRPEMKNCHFKGEVVNDPNSKVAISTCNGLAGFIQSREGDYFIEPIKGSVPSDRDHSHILYRRRNEGAKFKDSNCITRGKHRKMKNAKEETIFLKKEMPAIKSNKKILSQALMNEKKHDKIINKIRNKDNRIMNKKEDQDDEIESSDLFTPLPLIKQTVGNKLSKTKNSIKGKDNLENSEDIVEYKKQKHENVNKSIKSNLKPLNLKTLDNHHKKKCLYVKKNNESKQQKKIKQANNMKSNENISDIYNRKHSSEDSNNYKNPHYLLGIKDIKKNYKLSEKSNLRMIHDGRLIHKGRKKSFSQGVSHNNKLTEWDSVVKTMRMSDDEEKYNSNKKGNHKNSLSLSNERSKHNENTEAKQNGARAILKKERIKINKKNKGFAKHTDHKIILNDQTLDKRIRPDDYSVMDENGNRYSYNNYNETQYSDNYLYSGRNIRSLELGLDDKNITENSKMRRGLQYKSCKPNPSCFNKSEHTWDLRLLIVVSYHFSRHHRDIDLESYILTITNMVSANFHDASLGILLNVKLVRMVFIEYKLEELDEEKNSLEQLFENFCVFQYRINPHKGNHPNHHDVAVYVISFYQCADKIFGISNLGSMCHSKESCIVSHDEGLTLGNIITHQIGHSLGADHDDGGQGSCQPYEPDGSVFYHMNPMITLNSSQWSRCSSEAIQRFLRNQGSRCLQYLSTELDFDWPDILPGQIYSPVQQCALNLHMRTLPCYTGDFCKFLYCQATPKECVSLLVPPADGTPCASGMWCIRGLCVRKGRHPGMVNGEWSNWGPWSSCSKSCASGVQHAFRLCNNPPPALGGRYCVGKRLRYQICNADTSCGKFTASFRDHQCKSTDVIPFRGRFYTWRAFYNHFEYVECALLCESQTGIVAVRELVASDGTPCKPGTKNVCIQGKCVDVGCDWRINSGGVRDACGICHGNGTECRVIQGIFDDRNDGPGLVPFLKVPKGSGMIYARELNPSPMLIVVASYNTDTFYLNGPSEGGAETRPAEYDFGTVKGVYSVKGKMERIFIPGPTEEDLVFYVRFVDDTPNQGVRYQFAIPEVDKQYVPSYSWQFIDWETCSDACGGGQQRATAKCVEDLAGIVEGKFCLEREKPPDIIRSCNEFPCLPKWWVGAWSDCVEIANEKVRYRSVLCMRTRDPNSLRNEILKDKYCCDEEKPDSVRRCNETNNEKERVICEKSSKLPSIYNLKDFQNEFGDLKDFEKKLKDDPDEIKDYYDKNFESIDGGNEFPVSYNDDDDITLNTNAAEESKKHSNIRYPREEILLKEIKTPNSNIKRQKADTATGKESLKVTFNEDEKNKYGKGKINRQSVAKGEINLVPNIIQQGTENRVSGKNTSDKNKKITGLEKEIENIEPLRKGLQKLDSQQKEKLGESNNFQNKFRGATCKTVSGSRSSKKYPPIHLPTEPTCSKRCTTCPFRVNFTIPDTDFLTLRPVCPEVDQMITSEFMVSIIPIICDAEHLNPSDMFYEIFHESGSWPHGLEANKTIIKGLRAVFYLREIRETLRRQPFVFHAEN